MRIILIFILFFRSLTAADVAEPSCIHDATTFRCVKVLGNYDADTITIVIPGVHPLLGEKISVRVLGIDTPEIKGQCETERRKAVEAKELVSSILKAAKRVDIKRIGRDKYFRVLGEVEVDGVSIGEVLLKRGLAYRYDGGTKQDWCRKMRSPASSSKKFRTR